MLAWMLLTPLARGQEGASDEAVDDPRGDARQREVLAQRLIACVEAEGQAVTPQDRGMLQDVAASLGPAVARGLCASGGEQPLAGAACVARIEAASCEALASSLGPGAPAGVTATWAAGLSRAVASRIEACAAQELDGETLSPEDRAVIPRFEAELARALSTLASAGVCEANENLLPACAASVAATSCDGLGARLEEDPTALARTVTPACQAMLRCGAAAMDDGGAAAGDDASVGEYLP